MEMKLGAHVFSFFLYHPYMPLRRIVNLVLHIHSPSVILILSMCAPTIVHQLTHVKLVPSCVCVKPCIVCLKTPSVRLQVIANTSLARPFRGNTLWIYGPQLPT